MFLNYRKKYFFKPKNEKSLILKVYHSPGYENLFFKLITYFAMIVKKILLIDDDETSNYLVESTLRETFQDISVTKLTDGLDGLHYLKSLVAHKMELPDFIFLDLLMPTIDGFDFLSNLKKSKIDVPVFVLTANLKNHIIIKLDNYKIVDIIEKPLTTEKITNALNKLLIISAK